MPKQLPQTTVDIQSEVAETQNQTTDHNQRTAYKLNGQILDTDQNQCVHSSLLLLSRLVDVQIRLRMKWM